MVYTWVDYVWFTKTADCINVKKHTFMFPMHDAFAV